MLKDDPKLLTGVLILKTLLDTGLLKTGECCLPQFWQVWFHSQNSTLQTITAVMTGATTQIWQLGDSLLCKGVAPFHFPKHYITTVRSFANHLLLIGKIHIVHGSKYSIAEPW